MCHPPIAKPQQPTPIRTLRADIQNRLEVLRAEETQLKQTLLGLQLMCTHPGDTDAGYDPRGRGTQHYRCKECGKDWKE